ESYDIRVLYIEPGSGNDPIQCTLELVSLINPGTYTALSYCWGSLTLTAKIIVNTQVTPVRANLATALKSLREHGFLRVWVDALCINQEDRSERSLQVRNMIHIYSLAKFVFVWTG
ncbi:heterokaryon incompatibility protein-domain-containing protein, partial [Bisporella sp. PMI_857]